MITEKNVLEKRVRGEKMRKRLCAMLCITTLFLGGCGMAELTDTESDLISEYAASVLLKYSKTYQPMLQEKVYETETTQEINYISPAVTDPSNPQSGQNGSENANTDTVVASTKSLAEALGIAGDGFQVEYTGYETTASYPNTTEAYFSMTAANNKVLLVMKFNITNQSGEEKECNILAQQKGYRCQINSTERFGSQLTMLLDDLSSFKEVMADGETKQAVLIFQIPSEYEGTIERLDLTIRSEEDNDTYIYQ